MQTMTNQPIIEALSAIGIDKEVVARFTNDVCVRSYEAKDHVFHEGDSHPVVAYILSGYMRMYVTDGEGEISTRLLAGPGKFVGCIVNTLYDSPAQYSAECISDCELLVVNKNIINSAKQTPESRVVLQDIVLRHLVNMMHEKALMLPMKATDRYLFFKNRHPDLQDRIPAGILANYIGVRPQSLSRIKQMLR